MIGLRYPEFSDHLGSIRLGENDATYLITAEGKVLSAKGAEEDTSINGREYIKKVLEESVENDKGILNIKDDGVEYLVSYHKSPVSDWISISVIPRSEILEGANSIRNIIALFGFIFAVCAVVFGFLYSMRMASSLKAITVAMGKAENGDLTASVSMKRQDEIGKLANSFISMLQKIRTLVIESKMAVTEVGEASDNVAIVSSQSSNASREIARSVAEVAAGASEQAGEVQLSVDTVSQLADKIKDAVEGTKVMEKASYDVNEFTSKGILSMETLSKKASETNAVTSDAVKELSYLYDHVKNISQITKILKEIADQTSLLSLNAAIEAARAGNAGQGFTVVAQEVGKLAEQSAKSTKEIQEYIAKILKLAENTNNLVHKAEASINEQGDLVKETAQVFTGINNSISLFLSNITKIGDIMSDIDKDKGKVLSCMDNISAVSQQTAASSQEVSASVEEQLAMIEELDSTTRKLNSLTQRLTDSIEKFKV